MADADELVDEPDPLTVILRVNGQPRFDDTVAERVSFTEGQDIAFVLPSASGGNVALTYHLSEGLPPGLNLTPPTRTIVGKLSADELYAIERDGYTVTYWWRMRMAKGLPLVRLS